MGIVKQTEQCYLCSHREMEDVHSNYVSCKKCNLFINKSLPDKEHLKNVLRGFLLSACHSPNSRKERMDDADFQLKNLHEFTKPGKLFDVGAASGFFMKRAQENGWEVDGNDISETAVSWAKDNFGLDIHYGFFEDLDLPSNEYDAVVMWNSLEHTHNPAETIRMAKKILKPGGLMFIRVPEVESVERLHKYYQHEHFYEFRMTNLVSHLESEGWIKKKINKFWSDINKVPYRSETDYLFQNGN
tara:strand:+ start:609 stop:1340 length:732 start_codon:yes stop_codon:yes gene_type:complete